MANFFEGITDFLGLSNSNAEDAANVGGQLNLGNIFLPGGVQGGQVNTTPAGSGAATGFNGSPFTEKDFTGLRNAFAGKFDSYNSDQFRKDALAAGVTPEAISYFDSNIGNIRASIKGRNMSIEGVPWDKMAQFQPGTNYYGTPKTAASPVANDPAQPAPTQGPLGILGPAQNAFANVAAQVNPTVDPQTVLGPAQNVFANLATQATPDQNLLTALNSSAVNNLNQNTAGMTSNYLDILRGQAKPYEDEAFNRLNTNLFSRGRLGAEDSATGTAYREFAKGLGLADLGRQETALNFGSQETQNAFNRGITGLQTGSGLQTEALQRALGAVGGAQSTLQTSSGLQTEALQRALGAAGGAGALTQLSTLPFELALKLAIAQSNASLGQASSLNQTSASTTSPADLFSSFLGG